MFFVLVGEFSCLLTPFWCLVFFFLEVVQLIDFGFVGANLGFILQSDDAPFPPFIDGCMVCVFSDHQ